MPPHSLVMTMIGACLLWVGWFGFNAGSNLEASGGAALAMINTFVATAAAALSWMFAEWIVKGKPSLLGSLSGCIAGLVAVTPAAGYAGPMGAIVLGLIAGVVCLFFCSTIKNMFGYDDALDVFGIHCIGGIVGAILTGVLVAPALGGAGIMDYAAGKIADYDFADAGVGADQGGGPDAGVVRRRVAHHLQGGGLHRRPAPVGREGARRPRSHRPRRARLQHVSQVPSPVSCMNLQGNGRGTEDNGWGGYPAPPRPSGGPGRKTWVSHFLGLSLFLALRVRFGLFASLAAAIGLGDAAARWLITP